MPDDENNPVATPRRPRRVPAWLCGLLGANTLRGRFLYMSALLLTLLVLVAWLVDNRVQQVSRSNSANLNDRHRVIQLTRNMNNDLWEADQALQSSMLQVSAHKHERFLTALDRLIAHNHKLAETAWVQRTAGARELVENQLSDLQQLRGEGEQLIAVRASPERRFPAMPIMTGQMQPKSDTFISITALALNEAKDNISGAGQLEAMQLFSDNLYAWSRMIDAFRLFVSNRFGIFDTSPEAAMRAQAAVVEEFSTRLVKNFDNLTALDRQGLLSFEQSMALEDMLALQRDWHQAWANVQAIWTSEHWRIDSQLLQDVLEPLIEKVWHSIRTLEQKLATNSTEDLSLLTQVTTRISDSLWLVVLLALAGSLLMFVIFEVQIRRPIARVVAALKAEAAGEVNIAVPATKLVETRQLTQAFDHMRREVHSRQSRLEAVLHYAAEAIITIDENGRIESFNPAAEQLFGHRATEIMGRNVSVLMPAPHRERHDGYIKRYLENNAQGIIGRAREVEALHRDGHRFPVELNVSEMWVDGRRLFTGMLADISERKAILNQLEQTLAQLNTREQRLHAILNNTAEGIITFDEHGIIEGFNQSAEKLYGWVENEVLGTSIADLIAPETRETRDNYLGHFLRTEIQRLVGHEGELIGRHKDGSGFPMAVKISGMWLENRQKYIALVSNISERKAMMANLRRLAEHDGLTGLYNRSYFQGELERLVDRVRRSEMVNCALLYIDLDHFKYVNDTLGHAAGDKLLIEVANILVRRARKSDLVARLGGDEFTVLMYDIDPSQVDKVADSFRRQLVDYSFAYEGQSVTVGCSIGVAVIEPAAASPAEVMSRADLACHLAKRGGRNQIHVYAPEDSKNVANMSLDMGWSRRIREAIEHNRFTLAIQPIVDTRTWRVSTYEVLIRMRDEQGGLIMPNGFLPTAERFGLSLDIDLWVIENAIAALASQRGHTPGLCYTINLSAQTLSTPTVSHFIQEKITASGLAPASLIFEVTESAAISDMSAAVTLLTRLRTLGCRTALDDFGSGMSSFAYLKELPVDIVKIDGRFVRHIATNAVDQVMVRSMNDIAHALGKETIAEFVEDEAAYQVLIDLGVDYAQGYHLGRPEAIPMPAMTPQRAANGGSR